MEKESVSKQDRGSDKAQFLVNLKETAVKKDIGISRLTILLMRGKFLKKVGKND
jgi:hypothetical protein